MTKKSVPAATTETAFDCPHCGAFTTQFWHSLAAKQLDRERPTPAIPTAEETEEFQRRIGVPTEHKERVVEWIMKMDSRRVWMDPDAKEDTYGKSLQNLHVSSCYNCGQFSVWVHRRLVDPAALPSVQPNVDLPSDIATDFDEARAIVAASPRGAAALLRLAVQKLCKHLGQKGKNIDDDIAALVKGGLDTAVQQMLDVVRVIGNEAVHPGTIDLRDDQATASSLFGIVNAIAERMISQPKHLADLYAKLPQSKRDAIERRDAK